MWCNCNWYISCPDSTSYLLTTAVVSWFFHHIFFSESSRKFQVVEACGRHVWALASLGLVNSTLPSFFFFFFFWLEGMIFVRMNIYIYRSTAIDTWNIMKCSIQAISSFVQDHVVFQNNVVLTRNEVLQGPMKESSTLCLGSCGLSVTCPSWNFTEKQKKTKWGKMFWKAMWVDSSRVHSMHKKKCFDQSISEKGPHAHTAKHSHGLGWSHPGILVEELPTFCFFFTSSTGLIHHLGMMLLFFSNKWKIGLELFFPDSWNLPSFASHFAVCNSWDYNHTKKRNERHLLFVCWI